jgi:peptidoglycan/xylan/chitin deacetylase (PgdA/CDA1 family)
MIEIPVFHHVAEKGSTRIGPQSEYAVTPDQLATYLDRRRDWTSRWPHEEGGRDEVLLTFDDGYQSVRTHALPLLERFETRAIVFVTTGFVEGDIYPYELELADVIEAHDRLRPDVDSPAVELSGQDDEAALYQRLRRPLKPKSHRDRERRLDQLAELNRYDRSRFRDELFLSWDEVAELDRHPLVTIGAHTHTHPVLTRRAPWTTYQEMRKSKHTIEEVVGHPVRHFSYPYGRNNWLVRLLARLVGFQWAFTTEARCPEGIDDCDPMALPRPKLQDLL